MVWTSGVRLKGTGYKVELANDVTSVDITITNQNATTTTNYGGTFGGYDKGITLDPAIIRNIIESYNA